MSSDQEAIITTDIQQQCLPIDLRGNKSVVKMVRDKKRKLFHTQIYDEELAMKKMYIQKAKKLPAYGKKFKIELIVSNLLFLGCTVFQVKELLHGRTLRKVGVFEILIT